MTGSLAGIGAAGGSRSSGMSALMSSTSARPPGDAELEKTFQQTVAGMFFGQLVKSLRSTVGEPAYIHGGQAEEMFQAQFDQIVSEDLAENKGSPFVGDLYRQFRIQLGMTPEAGRTAVDSSLAGLGGRLGAETRISVAPGTITGDSRGSQAPAETAAIAPVVTQEQFAQNAPLTEKSAIAARLLQAEQATQATQQARSASQGVPATTVAAAFSGLFRK